MTLVVQEIGMRMAKITVTIDEATLSEFDRLVRRRWIASRSAAIAEAIKEKIKRVRRQRLARECKKLNPNEEQRMAEEGLAEDMRTGP
jgi:metal-responsive CopG/Arc/MetJ family transcriptional regulator